MNNGKLVTNTAYAAATDNIIPPNGSVTLGGGLLLGGQHVLAMFGSTVLAPILMGFDPNTAILFSGFATLLFWAFVGGKIPSYLGSSFSFIGAVIAATGYSGSGVNPNIPVALGGIIIAGLIYAIIGIMVILGGGKWIEKLFPPLVTGTIVAIIGLNLSRTSGQDIGKEPEDMLVGLITVLSVALISVYIKNKVLRTIPILLGLIIGTFAYYIFHNVMGFGKTMVISFSGVSMIGLPTFHAPVFHASAVTLIAPVAIILVAENLGHVKAVAGMTRQNLDSLLGWAFLGDGVATMISGTFGGPGVTTYAENMGVMRISRNFSSATMLIAGGMAIVLGLSPAFGAVIKSIPLPVIGGLSFILFGLISATAASIWQQARAEGKADLDDTRSLIVVGVSLVMGAGDFTVTFGPVVLGGIVTATLSAIILNYVLGLNSERTVPLSPYKSD